MSSGDKSINCSDKVLVSDLLQSPAFPGGISLALNFLFIFLFQAKPCDLWDLISLTRD